MTMIVTRMLVLTVKLQRMNYNNKLLRCRERVNRNSSKIWLSPSHNGVTRLKWLRASQPLPEDAPADRQIGARKVRMVASLTNDHYLILLCPTVER